MLHVITVFHVNEPPIAAEEMDASVCLKYDHLNHEKSSSPDLKVGQMVGVKISRDSSYRCPENIFWAKREHVSLLLLYYILLS